MTHRLFLFALIATLGFPLAAHAGDASNESGAARPAASPDAGKTAAEVDTLLARELSGGPEGAMPTAADDAALVRRLYLDLVGQSPTPEEMTTFLLDSAADKRARIVDQLLASEQFGEARARYWRDVILARRIESRAMMVSDALVKDLTEAINSGTSWDALARGFVTATGDVRQEGWTAVIAAQDGRTEETTAEMSRIFLGIQIQCAQCHDHMTDRWTREQFHQLAAFFPRTAFKPLRTGPKRTFVVVGDDKSRGNAKANTGRRGSPEHFMPDLDDPSANGKRMQPVFFLNGERLSYGTEDADRRSTLADWMIDSPWFAKAYVNRVWTELVGEGFYDSVDDLGPDRQPTAPQTLDFLADHFVASGYDTKWLYRTITATRAYQRPSGRPASDEVASTSTDAWQRLRADAVFHTLITALELDESQLSVGRDNVPRYSDKGPQAGFDQLFGFDPSEPRDQVAGTIPQALALMNAPTLRRAIDADSGRTMLGRLLNEIDDNEAMTVELYLRLLAREPQPEELACCLEYVQQTGQRGEAFEDILWALINSTELLHRR